MLWVKSLHIIFVITWMAAIFYLPRLFVYHVQALNEGDTRGSERFKIMERKLYYGIMAPGALLTVLFGLWLWLGHGPWGYWVHAKFALVLVLIAYHLYCGRLLKDFAQDRNTKTHVWFRWFNEFPVLILFAAVWLVLFKPF